MLLLSILTAAAEPIPVAVVETGAGWGLTRGGEALAVRGAGGSHDLAALAAIGGNAVRTWGVGEETAALLDEAHALGLTVAVGIWLGHSRHGFDYSDPVQVAVQKEAVRQAVLALRDHPAVLVWGVGNEMEGFADGDDAATWTAVCDIAELVRTLDPHHPIMTTTADIGGGRVDGVERCEAIDIHGVNSYGGAPSLLERYAEAGGRKPILLTEYGPPGSWESPRTDFGAPVEKTSTEKAADYAAIWQDVILQPGVLGGFAFTWGHKMEATATWFGLILPDGSRLGGVDALAEQWGEPPVNRAPIAPGLAIDSGDQRRPGEVVEVRWAVTDPDGDPLTTRWLLRPEAAVEVTGGDAQPTPPSLEAAILESGVTSARIRLPDAQGIYRLYAEVRDDHGGAATASLPLLVGPLPAEGAPLPMPWWLYQGDGAGGPWVPSGWMGDHEAVTMATDWTGGCASPPTCIRIEARTLSWAGLAWQHPSNNWGEQPGGLDLSSARHVTFKVRGEFSLDTVTFGVGLIGEDQPHPDSLRREKTVRLSHEWQTVRIRLRGDRSAISTGLWWVLPPQGRAQTVFYIDDVVFE